MHDAAKLRQVADRFADAQVARVVAGGLIAKQDVVTHILFDGAVLVLAANDGIAQVMVGDAGLETTPIGFGDAVAEDVIAAKPQLGFAIVRKTAAYFSQLLDELVERNMVRDVDKLFDASTHL